MNLLDALKTIEDNLRPGMTIDCWMLDNGEMMRRVMFNDGEAFASTGAEWEAAIVAMKTLSQLSTSIEGFTERYPAAVRRTGCPAESDHGGA